MSIANIKKPNNLSLFSKTLTVTNLNTTDLNIDDLSVDNLNAETIKASLYVDAPLFTSTYNNIVVKNINQVWQKSLSILSNPGGLQLGVFFPLGNIDNGYVGSSIQNCEVGNVYLLKCGYRLTVSSGTNATPTFEFKIGNSTIVGYVGVTATNTSPYRGEYSLEFTIQSYDRNTGALGIGYTYKNQYVSSNNNTVKDFFVVSDLIVFPVDNTKINGILPFNHGIKIVGISGTPSITIERYVANLKQIG
jgi:hypothetical protein